jgi:Phosphodiester glycosidase
VRDRASGVNLGAARTAGYPGGLLATKKSRWRRRALIALGGFAVGVPGLWLAIHTFPGLGPALADGVRAVVGPKPVAWAEDVAYGVQDRIDRWRYKDAPPKTFWETPTPDPAMPVVPAAVASGDPAAKPAPADEGFPPPAYAAPFAGVAAEGDGTWIPMKEPGMAKSLVHPDPKRSFAAVAVVAIDLHKMDLHVVAGTSEPASATVPADHRPGLIPKEVSDDLVAAFNGGFKATHGRYGMMLGGETFLPPRDIACTVGLFKDGAIKIRTWPALKDSEAQMNGYRQTPPCLVEEGKTNSALDDFEYTKNWGATVSGETVIRRSAIGIDKAGRVLFYGFGDAVTAQALSHAMKAIGAENAAQLDVNYSYPRFLMFEKLPEGPRPTSALVSAIKFSKYEYTVEPSPRDFFYLTRHRPAS